MTPTRSRHPTRRPIARQLGIRTLIFDRYVDQRGTGAFILVEPTTNFTAGAGMIDAPLHDPTPGSHPGVAERLAHLARTAPSEGEAIEAVRRALEELLT